ncbi:MAG: hypothetical protein LC790_01280 [Actinobacteria bacterium]|nr:hypothetical protein [Actinomycetota bacterium]
MSRYQDPECDGGGAFTSDVAQLETNASGNARGDTFIAPADVEGFEGVHGVMWTVRNAVRAVTYKTACAAVTLD